MAVRKKSPPKTRSAKKQTARKALSKKAVDFDSLPAELVTRDHREVCLACVLDVMTRHLGLSVSRAQLEIKRYTPSVSEIHSPTPSRPFFIARTETDVCPYCGAATKWRARIGVIRIESTKSTDIQRRALLKSLREPDFVIVEEKATQQDAFFQWVERIGGSLNLDDPHWLIDVSLHYLARKEPKTDWAPTFEQVRSIRRSRRIEEGWELDQSRLFLAPLLFDELLFVQYVMSRAHRAGGMTFEGRYTLPELFARLRNSGYLRSRDVLTQNPSDAFEQMLLQLGGGDTSQRFYYVVDRRDLLERTKALKDVRVPRAKNSKN